MPTEFPATKTRSKVSLHTWLVDHPTLVRVLSVVCFLCFWQYFGYQSNPMFMTYPSAIGQAFVTLISSGELQARFLESLVSFVIGLALSIAIGIPLGLFMGSSTLRETWPAIASWIAAAR